LNWTDLGWADVAEPAGARQAPLWGDPKTSAYGILHRWKFNSKVAPLTRSRDVHFFVLAGTFTLEIDGVGYREFGPGAYARVPGGVRYTAGCEAAGECRFLQHQAGPADVVQ
jgi:mannose-6-phosphate isomerase-like protein (cupin superfamily)